LWADGHVEGDPRLGADERALDVGEEGQLARVIEVLKAAAQAPDAHPLQALQAEISGLPTIVSVEEAATIHATLPKPALISEYEVRATMTEGMQKVQRAALREIGQRAGVPAVATTSYDEWLRALLSDFEAWRTRVAKGER